MLLVVAAGFRLEIALRVNRETEGAQRRFPWMSVGFFHGLGLIIPLALLRQLTHALGSGEYGRYVFVTAIAQYCAVVVEWGFITHGPTRVAAICEISPRTQYIANALLAKAFIAVAVGLIVALVPFVTRVSLPEGSLYVIGFTIVGTILNTSFVYIGINRLLSFLVIQALVRILALAAVISLVHDAADLRSALVIGGGTTLFTSVALIANLFWSGHVAPVRLSAEAAIDEMREAGLLSMASLASSIYTTLATVIVGLFVRPAELASFSVSYSVVRMTQAIGIPISQILTPRVVATLSGARRLTRQVRLLRRFLSLQVLFAGLAILLLCTIGPPLLALVVGPSFEHLSRYLFILAPVVLFGGVSTLISGSILVPLHRQVYVTAVVVFWAALSIPLTAVGSRYFGAQGGAIAIFMVEFAIVVSLGLYLKRIYGRILR